MEKAHTDYRELISDATTEAIRLYATMAQTGEPPPESFLRDICAVQLFNKEGWCIRPEFPARHAAELFIDTSNGYKSLSKNFLIDLVCFRRTADQHEVPLFLVEFTLWTSIRKIAREFDRLKEFISLSAKPQSKYRIKGYVVCTPHYETSTIVKETIEELRDNSKREFTRFDFHASAPFQTGDHASGPAASVIVIDVGDCDRRIDNEQR